MYDTSMINVEYSSSHTREVQSFLVLGNREEGIL